MWVSVSTYASEVLFCLEVELKAQPCWFALFDTSKEQKKVDSDGIIDTFAAHAIFYLCHTQRHWLLDTKFQYSWLCCHDFLMSVVDNQTINQQTKTAMSVCVLCVCVPPPPPPPPFLLNKPMMLLLLGSPLAFYHQVHYIQCLPLSP